MTAKSGAAAVANADKWTSYDVGMCLQWVRWRCWDVGSFYGSAIDAWHGARRKHPGDRNPPKGAPLFYSGGSYGHIVICRGGPRMRSTDCQSSGRVSDADLSWPEGAWGDSYLGWAEDLNGVDLPLDTGGTGEDDDMPQYDHGSSSKAQKIKAGGWQAITWPNANGPAITPGDNVAHLGGRQYTASLKVTVDAPKGSTVKLQCVEMDSGEVAETNPQTEVPATGGSTYGSHEQIGAVKAGRNLRWRITCTADATMTHADVTVLSW